MKSPFPSGDLPFCRLQRRCLSLWRNICQQKSERRWSQTRVFLIWGFIHHKYLPDNLCPPYFTDAWTGVKTEKKTGFLLSISKELRDFAVPFARSSWRKRMKARKRQQPGGLQCLTDADTLRWEKLTFQRGSYCKMKRRRRCKSLMPCTRSLSESSNSSLEHSLPGAIQMLFAMYYL